jgi:hypothetical protein
MSIQVSDLSRPGLYKIYWIYGGSSEASVHRDDRGVLWFEPRQWLAPVTLSDLVISDVDRVVPLRFDSEPTKTVTLSFQVPVSLDTPSETLARMKYLLLDGLLRKQKAGKYVREDEELIFALLMEC